MILIVNYYCNYMFVFFFLWVLLLKWMPNENHKKERKKKHKIQRDITIWHFAWVFFLPLNLNIHKRRNLKKNTFILHPLGNKNKSKLIELQILYKKFCFVLDSQHEICRFPQVLRILLVCVLYIYTTNKDFSSHFFFFFNSSFFVFYSKVNNFNFCFNLHFFFCLFFL